MDVAVKLARGPGKLPRWLHVPLPAVVLGAFSWLGYYSHDHLFNGFDLICLGPWILSVATVLSFLSAAVLAWRSPQGRKAYVILLHFAIVIVVATASWYVGPPLGRWVWEKSVLAPRRGALVEFSKKPPSQDGGPVSIEGYIFERYETTSEGVLFYAFIAGGPWKSEGLFVPYSEAYRGFSRPEQGKPEEAQSVVPTAVRGLYWFVTRR
jgi:hypothetical protein